MSSNGQIERVAFIGTYVPRLCGIATFTNDLCQALSSDTLTLLAVPVNDRPGGYDYPPPVRFTIEQNDAASYRRAAQYININHVDAVSLQHEYGIFGGPAGSHILALLAELRTPVVTTLHTILRDPNPEQRRVMEHLSRLSDRLVVMSRRAVEFLETIYSVPAAKIDFIPHGIPDMPFVDPSFYKDQFGVDGRFVLLTFGLLAPSKGVEQVIRAMPAIKKSFPNVVYLIVGATHPHVLRQEGELYRLGLQRLVRELRVEENVAFHNRFVTPQELIEFIGAADIYITPYPDEAQITSGTLAWAVGAGKPVISTPYWYAEELLAEERGLFVPFNDADAIAQAVIRLLENEPERHAMRKRAYLFARDMIWPTVAKSYLESFRRAHAQRAEHPRRTRPVVRAAGAVEELPAIHLHQLRRLTDETGMLQHAVFSVPNFSEGHTTDDNARALALMVLLEESSELPLDDLEDLETRYLAFLVYAYNRNTSRFRTFLGFEPRRWLEEIGSEDSHGQALRALGLVAGRSRHAGLRDLAVNLFTTALPATQTFTSPRTVALTVLGIKEYLRWLSADRVVQEAGRLQAQRLVGWYEAAHGKDWPWFEDRLTYGNALLPHALLAAGEWFAEPGWTRLGLTTLEWLVGVQRADAGHFVPIGSNGFYVRGQDRARFDQQPIEAYATVSACLEAFRITADINWHGEAVRAFDWFLGRNDLGLPLADPRTGGCHDGLHPERVNANQGAESTLAYLLSLTERHLGDQGLSISRESGYPSQTETSPMRESYVGQQA